MASSKKQPQPQPGVQLTPTTMALMLMTLLVGIIIGYIIGAGTKGEETTSSPGTTQTAERDRPAPPKQGKANRRTPQKVQNVDSPFTDDVASAKFEGKEDAFADYTRAVDFVGRRNARAATPLLDKLVSGEPDADYQEEVALLVASNKVNQNVAQEALDALADWRHRYPESRLKAQASLIEGKAHMQRGRGLAGGKDTPTGEARTAYEQARDIFIEVTKEYAADETASGEALFHLGSVYGQLGDEARSLASYDDLVAKYPQHGMAARALYSVANGAWSDEDYDKARTYFQKLLDHYPNDGLSKRARKNINALGIIGQDAPELQVSHWINGTGTTLADNRGKVVLLTFWNEWCPHCKREMPKMGQLQQRYGDQGLVIIPVTKHTKKQTDEKIVAFMEGKNISLPCAVEADGYQSSRDYGVSGVPAAAIVDREGRIVWRNHPARLTDARLEELLAQ